jgi:HEAT repeat protein
MLHASRTGPGRWASQLIGAALASLSLCGCAGFWDKVTSRDFEMSMLFKDPNPFVVLRDSTDGDQRARALRALHEPAQNGATSEDQEAVIKILTTAATSDRQPLCRLAAIQSLGGFKDPRAVRALTEAFENAPFERPYEKPPKHYTSDTTTIIQSNALVALGNTRNPLAVETLVRVAKEPPPASNVSDQEKQQARDRHIAAVRALGNFKHYQATDALLYVLKNEKDVALKDRAHESLQEATGKTLPPDPKQWELVLNSNNGPDATANVTSMPKEPKPAPAPTATVVEPTTAEPGPIRRVMNWLNGTSEHDAVLAREKNASSPSN